jgi:hypothetical protein
LADIRCGVLRELGRTTLKKKFEEFPLALGATPK